MHKAHLKVAAVVMAGLFVFACSTVDHKGDPTSYETWKQSQTNKAEAMQDSMMQATEKVYAK